jgi:hypothetical protein
LPLVAAEIVSVGRTAPIYLREKGTLVTFTAGSCDGA